MLTLCLFCRGVTHRTAQNQKIILAICYMLDRITCHARDLPGPPVKNSIVVTPHRIRVPTQNDTTPPLNINTAVSHYTNAFENLSQQEEDGFIPTLINRPTALFSFRSLYFSLFDTAPMDRTLYPSVACYGVGHPTAVIPYRDRATVD